MTEHQSKLLGKARKAIDTAHKILDAEDPNAAINRAYYAAHYAATAALLAVSEAPISHAGVQHQFHLRFVRSGQILERAEDEPD